MAAFFACERRFFAAAVAPRLGLALVRCCGGLLATTSTARSKRRHASGSNSMAGFTSPEDERFFGAIGRLTISWGHVDVALDVLVYEAHTYHGGDKLIEREAPISFQRKIRYLRKAFRKIPTFQPYNERFEAIANALVKESKTRHDIIHGFVVHHLPKTSEAVMFRWPPGEYRGKPFNITTAKILEAAVRVQKLNVLALAFEVQRWVRAKKPR